MIQAEILCHDQSELGVKKYMNQDYKPVLGYLDKLRNGTVLNLGGHIGWFDWWIDEKWPAMERCVSVEPNPDSFELLKHNCAIGMPKSIPIHGGIGGQDGELMEMFLGPTHSATNTVLPVKGRRSINVPCVSLERLIGEYDPSFVKLDTEGAEYVIDISLFRNVQLLTGELHHNRKGLWEEQLRVIREIHELGFNPVRPPHAAPQFYGVTSFTYWKP